MARKTRKNPQIGKKSIALFIIILIITTTFAFVMPMKSAEADASSSEEEGASTNLRLEYFKVSVDGLSWGETATVTSRGKVYYKFKVLGSNGRPSNGPFTLNRSTGETDTITTNPYKGISKPFIESATVTLYACSSKDDKEGCTKWESMGKVEVEVVVKAEEEGGETPSGGSQPETVSSPASSKENAWWTIPCLGFLKTKLEPKAAKQLKWGPFSSWVDAAWTAFSFMWALGFARTGDLNNEFKCVEERPLEEDKCEECEADPFRVCTSERCVILGKNCFAVERDDGKGYHCFKGECEDNDLAKINRIDFKWYVGSAFEPAGSESSDSNQLKVSKELPWNVTQAFLSTKQDKEAKCRWIIDTNEANFSNMNDFDENEKYPTEQSINIDMSEIKTGEHYIFIKCRNKCNVMNPPEDDNNYVKFKIAEIPEGIPPIIDYINPAPHSFIDDRQKNLTIEIWLNENVASKQGCVYSTKVNNLTSNWSLMIPFEGPHGNSNNSVIGGECINNQDCRYITKKQCAHCFLYLNLTKGYEQLNETFAELLQENFTEMNLSELLNTESGLAKYFNFIFRCQDTNGNKNEGDLYSILTIPPYNVYVLEPENLNETYERENLPIEVETYGLNATGDNVSRSTYCHYKVLDGWPKQPQTIPGTKWDDLAPIDDTLSSIHIGTINRTLQPSTYTMFVRCRDLARIEIANWSYFKILKDAKTPVILRMYHDTTAGDYLIVETDEESECVYGTRDSIKCNYNFSDGSAMMTTDKFLHAAYWQPNNLYYIKCKDRWDNYPGNRSNANVCTAIIDPYEVPPL
ncbi:MAG: hypothetical protein ACPLXC_00630 [Candidatus Pacearchaeota archaeon]